MESLLQGNVLGTTVHGQTGGGWSQELQAIFEEKSYLHSIPIGCWKCYLLGSVQDKEVQGTAETQSSRKTSSRLKMGFVMLKPRFFRYYVLLTIPIAAYMFGNYLQKQNDETLTLYRNKSKLYGGRKLEEGEKAW